MLPAEIAGLVAGPASLGGAFLHAYPAADRMFTFTPARQQEARAFQFSLTRREVQRGETLSGASLRVGPVVDQHPDHVRMMFRRGPHQRRLMLQRLLRVHVGPGGNQQPHARRSLPVPAQVMIGVSPVAIAVFGLAPAFSSRSTSAAFPLVHASDSGVMRRSLAAFTSAPARINRSAISRSFQWAAQSSAVAPSSDRTLTSAPLSEQGTDGRRRLDSWPPRPGEGRRWRPRRP